MGTTTVAAIIGPTASGKSDLAVAVAVRLYAEVVNADAMQLYRNMDVGTAKLSPAEQRGIRHHLLDALDIGQTATVASFQRTARMALADCHHRGVLPILVGGSALYIRAVLDEFEFPGTDPDVRTELEGELERLGAPAMHARLAARDPDAAAAILPTNGRRIVRALEVVQLTGKPFGARLPAYNYALPGAVQVGLDVPREILDQRIRARVARMWAHGFVDEVRRLERAGLRDGLTASRALGYAQILRFLAGECTEDEAYEHTIRATCRFARRQDSWFRKDPRIVWLPYDAPELVDQTAAILGR